jgi:hypothetical protein
LGLELNKQLIAGVLTLTILSCAAWTLTAAIQIAPNRNSRVFMDISCLMIIGFPLEPQEAGSELSWDRRNVKSNSRAEY